MFNLAEIRAAVAELKGQPEYIAACLALYGGLRSEECLGLKWSEIDFTANTLTVCNVRQYAGPNEVMNDHTRVISGERSQIEKACPKNGKARTFTMPEPLVAALKEHQQTQRKNRLRAGLAYHMTEYVCTRENGTLLSQRALSMALKPLCTFHQLRHAHISWMLDAGVPVTEVARRVGHSNTSITLDIYAHAAVNQDQQAAAALSTL